MMPNGEMDLANIPAYVNVVTLSFAAPDCTYVKGVTLQPSCSKRRPHMISCDHMLIMCTLQGDAMLPLVCYTDAYVYFVFHVCCSTMSAGCRLPLHLECYMHYSYFDLSMPESRLIMFPSNLLHCYFPLILSDDCLYTFVMLLFLFNGMQ
jgi:hypothetical protein